MSDLIDVVKGVATVALTVYGLRWLTTAKGSDSPRIHGEIAVYGIRWQIRAVAYAAAALFFVLALVDLRADLARGRWVINVLFAAARIRSCLVRNGSSYFRLERHFQEISLAYVFAQMGRDQ